MAVLGGFDECIHFVGDLGGGFEHEFLGWRRAIDQGGEVRMAGGVGKFGGGFPIHIGGKTAGTDVQQHFHRSGMAVFRSKHHGGAAVVHAGVNGRAIIGKGIDGLGTAEQGGQQQGGVQSVPLVGSEFGQGAGGALADGEGEGIVAIGILQQRIGPLLKQPAHGLRLV